MNVRLLLFPIVLLLYCCFVNTTKFNVSIATALIHVVLQFSFLFGLFVVFQRYFIFRFVFAFFIGIGLFTKLSYDSPLSVSLVMSVFSTSSDEFLSFIRFDFVNVLLVFAFIAGMLFLPLPKRKRIHFTLPILGAFYVFIPTLFIADKVLSSTEFDNYVHTGLARGYPKIFISFEYLVNKEFVYRLPALNSIKGISDSISFFFQQAGSNSTWTHVVSHNSRSDFLVIGIGESLRADNLAIFGYERETTPNLSRISDTLDIYKDTFSAGPNTWNSLPTALTRMAGKFNLSHSIINLAKDAGYETYWISNHAKTSHWDFSVSAIAEQADHTFFFSNDKPGSVYDIELVSKLKDIIRDKKNKTLVILHFYGSHMYFSDRYPEIYSTFEGENSLLNEYDNSVLYTDFVQNEVIKLAEHYNASYLYFADHGLGQPNGEIPLKHDVRVEPALDSLKVPLFIYPRVNDFKIGTKPISLYYFECVFSAWSGIYADELTDDNYCQEALDSEEISFIDSNLELHNVEFSQ